MGGQQARTDDDRIVVHVIAEFSAKEAMGRTVLETVRRVPGRHHLITSAAHDTADAFVVGPCLLAVHLLPPSPSSRQAAAPSAACRRRSSRMPATSPAPSTPLSTNMPPAFTGWRTSVAGWLNSAVRASLR